MKRILLLGDKGQYEKELREMGHYVETLSVTEPSRFSDIRRRFEQFDPNVVIVSGEISTDLLTDILDHIHGRAELVIVNAENIFGRRAQKLGAKHFARSVSGLVKIIEMLSSIEKEQLRCVL